MIFFALEALVAIEKNYTKLSLFWFNRFFFVITPQELVVESQMQSIFTDIGKVDFRDPCNNQLIPAVPGLPPNSTTSAAWLSNDGEALFALPSAAGGIFVLKLPPYYVPGKNGNWTWI